MENDHRKEDLLFLSHRRDEFISELREEIVALGGKPRMSPSPVTDFWSVLRGAREAVVGFNAGDALTTCVHVEQKTQEAYDRALLARMPPRIHAMVERQRAEIERDVAILRRDSFLR